MSIPPVLSIPTGKVPNHDAQAKEITVKSKYEPFAEFLSEQRNGAVTLTFRKIERIIGQPLPSSAFQYREWWANQTDSRERPQCRAWQKAGFQVLTVSSGVSGCVQFTKGAT